MKATGEVMAIGTSFEQALMKAVRGAEIKQDSINMEYFHALSNDEIEQKLHDVNDLRLFCIFEALHRGITTEQIHNITKIDLWFLNKLQNLVEMERTFALVASRKATLTPELYLAAKNFGYTDHFIV